MTEPSSGSSTDAARCESAQARLVAREAGGTGAAGLIGMGLRYVAMLCATRALGGERYGDYTLALAVTGILITISGLGLSPGVLPFLSRARQRGRPEEIRAVVRSALIPVACLSLFLVALLGGSSSWLGRTVFDKPGLQQFLLPLGALVVLGGLSATVLTLLQGFLKVKERAWIEQVAAMAVTGTGMALAWSFGWGAPGVIWATLAGVGAGLLLGGWSLAREAPGFLRPKAAAGPLEMRRLLCASWPLMGTSMLAFLLLWTDVLLMGIFRESGEVGIYGACARLAPLVLLVHESLGPIFVARLSDLHASGDWKGISHLYRLTARWALWPGLVLAWTLAIWSSELLSLFGREFVAGSSVLVVLVIGKAVAVSMGLSGRVFGVTGGARLNLINMILLVGGNVILNLLWIPAHGALGAAAATTISLASVRMLQVVELWLMHRMLPFTTRSLIPVLSVSLLAALAYPLRKGLPAAGGWPLPLVVFLLCCAVVFLLAGVTPEDREVWRALRERLRRPGGGPVA